MYYVCTLENVARGNAEENFSRITNPANVGKNFANFCNNRLEFGQFRGRRHISKVTSKRQLSTEEEAIVVISNSG
jgi:DNA polymerase III gamma/tau subunit